MFTKPFFFFFYKVPVVLDTAQYNFVTKNDV